MQESENRQSIKLTYPVGCSADLRCAFPFYAMIVCGVLKAWNNDSIPYPQHPKLLDLLNAFASLQLDHVRETFGDGAAQELQRLVRLLSEVFERLEAEQGTFPPVGGKA